MDESVSWRRGWLGSMRVRIVAVVVALLVLSSAGSVLVMRAVLFDRLDDEVRVDLDQEAAEFRLLLTGVDPRTGEPFAGDVEAIFDVYFSREVPDEGETLLSFVDGELYESRRAQDAADPGELGRAIDYWLSLEEAERGAFDTPLGRARYVAIPISGGSEEGLFVVANFPEFERTEIDEAVQVEIAVQVAALAVAALLGLALAGRVLRPLRHLATTAQTISDTDLTRRIPVSGRDEASQIARAFNDMLTRLEGAFTTQRRFLDDTSHELRSPLTVIRGHLELLELDTTAEERAETVALVTDEIDRMSQIVNDLSLLARAERPDFLHPEHLDLRDLVLSVHRKLTALADRDWQVEVPEAAPITGDRNRLTQALLQLGDNAVKFTDGGAAIRIGAAVSDGQAHLWVDDAGAGVSPDDVERVFERFTRGTGAVGANPGGRGLGLAIVRAIAEAHGGHARLASRAGPGARFVITIPATAAGPATRPPR